MPTASWPPSNSPPDGYSLTVGIHSARGFVARDRVGTLQRQADVVEPVQQSVLREVVDLERDVEADGRRRDPLVLDVDDHLEVRVLLDRLPQPLHRRLVDGRGDEAHLSGVVAEDVGEAWREHCREAVVHQRPHRVLTRRARSEVRTRDEDVGARVALLVEHEVGVLAPFGEQPRAEPGALDPLQPVARDDLIGVDVGPHQRHRAPGDDSNRFHQLCSKSLGVAKWPAMAVAAATAGDTRMRAAALALAALEVAVRRGGAALAGRELVGIHREAHRAAGLAPVESRGAEHLVEPFGFGLRLDRRRPRHDEGAHAGLHLPPCATLAAARRSSMREFVHEPMNTVSTSMSRIGVRAFNPM